MQNYINRQIVINDHKKEDYCDSICDNMKDKTNCELCCNKCIYNVNDFKKCVKDCMEINNEKKYIIQSNGK